MTHSILARTSASVTDLKRDPMGTVSAGDGDPVVILNRNQPAFYCVPAELWQEMLEIVEDAELNALAEARKDEERVAVTLDEL